MKKAFFGNQQDTILTQAIKRKAELNQIKKIIIQEPELINIQGTLGNTPICLAVKQGNCELVSYLLEKGANPNATNNLSNTPLIWAMKEPKINQKVIYILLEYNADINSVGHMNKTPLTWAVIHEKTELIELFLQKGADPNIPDKEIGTPVFRATIDDNLEIVQTLLEYGAKYYLESEQDFGIRLLYTAASKGYRKIADLLITQTINAPKDIEKIDFNTQWYGEQEDEDNGNTALLFALQNGYLSIARSLIKVGSSLEISNDKGQTALHYLNELDANCQDSLIPALGGLNDLSMRMGSRQKAIGKRQ